MMVTATSTDSDVEPEKLNLILSRILAHIRKNGESDGITMPDEANTAINELVAKLGSICPPSDPLSILVPQLFLSSKFTISTEAETAPNESVTRTTTGETQSIPISSEDALSIITFLVAHNPATFLVPTSRLVRLEAERISSSPQRIRLNSINENVLNAIVGQLQSSSCEVGVNATNTLLALCKVAMGGNDIGDGTTSDSIAKRIVSSLACSYNEIRSSSSSDGNKNHRSTVTVRYASLIISILTLSHIDEDEFMQASIQNQSLDLLVIDSLSPENDDPLLQMSILDQVERLATIRLSSMSEFRRRWLTSSKVVKPLLRMAGGEFSVRGDDISPRGSILEDTAETATAMSDSILGGSALRILSSICKICHNCDHVATLLSEEELLAGFHRALLVFAQNAKGEVDRIALVDAISSLASISERTLTALLEDTGQQSVMLREKWLDVGSIAQPKLKALVLFSIARVMDSSLGMTNLNENHEMAIQELYIPSSQICLNLFRCFGQVNNNGNSSSELLLLNFTNSPFVEVRLSAYQLMNTLISKVKTGATLLLSQVGFLEFLLSNERETVKEGKEAKYAIVQAVLASATRDLLTDRVIQDLEKIVREGPYFTKSVNWQLATEQ